jgi:hypothetical protein
MTAMVVVWALQPVVRRAVPLAWLLRLGMLWPGPAPSRFKVARGAGRVRDLEERLARAQERRETGDAERAAERIRALVAALTSHDRRTRGHAERVRVFTDLLAIEFGLGREDRDRLRWSALLHDIGKLEVARRILNKPGKLTDEEYEVIKRHPVLGGPRGEGVLEATWLCAVCGEDMDVYGCPVCTNLTADDEAPAGE